VPMDLATAHVHTVASVNENGDENGLRGDSIPLCPFTSSVTCLVGVLS